MSGGNCPETPRQKMIGMMYLMLTAMLALNVSGDLLNAFNLVDQSIRGQIGATDDKLGLTMMTFSNKAAENPEKVKPKYDLAQKVKALSDSMYNNLQDLKCLFVLKADGPGTEEEPMTPEHYLSTSNQDIAAQVMIVEQPGNERYKKLKEDILAYRDAILEICKPDSGMPVDSALVNSINASINVDDPPVAADGEQKHWENQIFEHIPLAATMCLMSAIQSNVRNVETDVVNYLYKMVDAASFKFSELVPLIIPEAQYVIQGGEYKASIMLAAYDPTMEPIVSVGGEKLPVEYGQGKYRATASSVGMKSYNALLQIPDPVTGVLKPYQVEGKYEVGAPSLVVSATKMNAMYRGLMNPIEVSVAGVSPSDLQVACAGGAMSKASEGYQVKPSAAKEITITVTSNIGGKSQNYGSKKFRVFDVPDPVVVFEGAKNGKFKKSDVGKAEVKADLKDFVFDVKFQVTQFAVSTTKNGFLVSETVKGGGKLDKKAQDLIRGVSRNGKVFVESVRAKGPDGKERQLNGVSFLME